MIETKSDYFCTHSKLSIKNVSLRCPLRQNYDNEGCFACKYLSVQTIKGNIDNSYDDEYENPDFLEIL
jgi:hypothetical protein